MKRSEMTCEKCLFSSETTGKPQYRYCQGSTQPLIKESTEWCGQGRWKCCMPVEPPGWSYPVYLSYLDGEP
jgi:hypothetical protein